jgi:hypothetical protein
MSHRGEKCWDYYQVTNELEEYYESNLNFEKPVAKRAPCSDERLRLKEAYAESSVSIL